MIIVKVFDWVFGVFLKVFGILIGYIEWFSWVDKLELVEFLCIWFDMDWVYYV